MIFREVPVELIRPIRHRVLRPHQTLAECVYPGDEDPQALHYGAVENGELIGIGSIFPWPLELPPGIPVPELTRPTWRLRGMAVIPEMQGQGIGQLLLTRMLQTLDEQGVRGLVWANARAAAARFYIERMGWTPLGEEFEKPGLGPHQVMVFPLGVPLPEEWEAV